MRASILLIAFSALAAAQQASSEPVDTVATTTETGALETPTDTVVESPSETAAEETSTETSTEIGSETPVESPTETATETATTSQPLIPTGTPSNPVGSSSGFTSSPSPTSSSTTSTSSDDSTSTETQTETETNSASPTSDSDDAEETGGDDGDNGAAALPVSGSLLGAGLLGALMAGLI